MNTITDAGMPPLKHTQTIYELQTLQIPKSDIYAPLTYRASTCPCVST